MEGLRKERKKGFPCPHCPASCSKGEGLESHLFSEHQIGGHPCPDCDKKYGLAKVFTSVFYWSFGSLFDCTLDPYSKYLFFFRPSRSTGLWCTRWQMTSCLSMTANCVTGDSPPKTGCKATLVSLLWLSTAAAFPVQESSKFTHLFLCFSSSAQAP